MRRAKVTLCQGATRSRGLICLISGGGPMAIVLLTSLHRKSYRLPGKPIFLLDLIFFYSNMYYGNMHYYKQAFLQ